MRMRIGMVGLGKMGGNMTSRLLKGGHGVVVLDHNQDAISKAEAEGADGAESLEDLVSQLKTPRIVWIMVPAGDPTESLLNELGELLSDGD
ncbi:MAG: NAD(P)-binding domain-containing protein, partial [Anaerolineales bacterium]